MKLISACLLGIRYTWNSSDNKNDRALELSRVETLIPVCPEQLRGLATPRAPQEIQGGTWENALDGKCKIMNKNGEDVTKEFIGEPITPPIPLTWQYLPRSFLAGGSTPLPCVPPDLGTLV